MLQMAKCLGFYGSVVFHNIYMYFSKKQRHYLANKGQSSQRYGFSSSHVWMCELEHKEGWAPKNRCFWTVVLEKALKSPLDCKEIKPVNPKGNQSWIFIRRTDAEAELQYFGHLMWRADSLEKSLMLGKLKAGEEGDDKGWDGWMASLIQWKWVWVNCRSWWWTGRPDVLQSMGLQRVKLDWTELTEWHNDLPYKGRMKRPSLHWNLALLSKAGFAFHMCVCVCVCTYSIYILRFWGFYVYMNMEYNKSFERQKSIILREWPISVTDN